MQNKHKWSFLLLVIALVPFIKLYLSNSTNNIGIEATGNAVSAASEQYMAFMLDQNELFNYFMDHYSKGLFKFEDEENHLQSTLIVLESIKEIGKLQELSATAQKNIITSAHEFYETNKLANSFSPTYTYAYYGINKILGNELGKNVEEELITNTLKFKMEKSIFMELSDAIKPDLKETLNALELLNGVEHDLTEIKKDVIAYINAERVYGEVDTYYISRIAELIGEESEIPRTTLIGCIIKQYIPFVNSDDCAKLLKEKNILTYFPSAFLLIASYFMLTYKPYTRKPR
ncbi:MAG: hypothetical protein GON13_03095 [Nanoarchaeota archaeon]|nr:hypothetical protein [Nanoarchaeota archaeon]